MTKLRTIRIAICLLWLVMVGVGFALVLRYENTPGGEGEITSRWPAETALKLDSGHANLILFAHPQCPCTRATIEELNRLLARTKTKVHTQVWFFQPTNFPASWSRSDLWRSAERIPGLTVQADVDGREAKLFGAETSGSVLLYDAKGQLLFKGGITSGRGHMGDNAGESSIAALLDGKSPALNETPVYGCSMLSCERGQNP
ncbi:MAG TPA: hypothetical protein VGH19_04165 [Verrucomicrobiae bacterium]